MANEITLGNSLSVTKNGVTFSGTTVTGKKIDMAGNAIVRSVQPIGTTEETIGKGEIGTIGYVQLRNLDATNYVEVGVATGVYPIRLKPGQSAVFPTNNASNVFARANTAACNLEYLLIEA